MQRRTISMLVLGSLVLSACGGGVLGGPQSGPDVSGKLIDTTSGQWPTSGTKLALVGVTDTPPYTVAENNQQQIVDVVVTNGFTYDLPKTANNGFYRLLAFVDGSKSNPADGKYQSGEITSDSNGKYLIYSDGSFTAFGKTVGQGWNLYNTADNTVTPSGAVANDTFSGYDLTYPANP